MQSGSFLAPLFSDEAFFLATVSALLAHPGTNAIGTEVILRVVRHEGIPHLKHDAGRMIAGATGVIVLDAEL